MDTDELDQWLEVDDGDGVGSARAEGWATPPPNSGGRTGRPRWLWPGVAAVVLWVGVMAVWATQSADPEDLATPLPSDMVASPDPTPAVPVMGTSAGDLVTSPTEAEQAGTADPPAEAPDHTIPGPLQGAAVGVLRRTLTTSSPDGDSYLELATPVALTELAEGAVVVVLEAVWLEGADGQLDQVHQGRWAVPLAADGTQLGRPWPSAAGPTDVAVPEEPPVGTVRLPEVEVALTAAGWTDVQAVAAQDHPFISGVLVALVRGVPPSGRAGDGHVVWLQDAAEGLVLLGSQP